MNMIHVFQSAGLGVGPFKFNHVTAEGGHCQYCATAILWRFYLTGSDGRTFYVGSDCVMKTGDAGLMRVVDAEVKRRMAEARKRNDTAKLDALRAALTDPAVQAVIASKPHPNAWHAQQGKTMWDYVLFMKRCAGKAGMLRLAKMVAKLTEV